MFFKIEQEDVNCFLNFHQVYKHTILQKMNNNGFDVEVNKKVGRAGSYWVPNHDADEYNQNKPEDEKSFYTKIQNFVIQDNYV